MTRRPPRPPRVTVSLGEVLIGVAILSTLCALLVPAVDAARGRRGQPPLLPLLEPLYDGNPWLFLICAPAIVTTYVAACFGTIRRVLPEAIRRHFPWELPEKPSLPPPAPIADSRPAIVALSTALGATALLVFVASHVRVDRTNRRPVVTWEGPIAGYARHVAVLGWVLSAIAIVLGAYTPRRFRSKLNPLAVVGMALGFLNYFGSCLFNVAVYED
jgi:hypothetical protein